ncbi:MAG TPA: hypothetical protein VGL98_02140 [Gammaproteobacteria bacterium]
MLDRRSFITSTISFATAVAVGNETQARSGAATANTLLAPTASAVALVDRSLDGSAAFAAAARARGLGTLEFTVDAARIWMRELEPRLRSGPMTIAGYTSAATWFCLDLLSRDFGARTVQRTEETNAVRFLISQTPGRRAALAPAAVRAQWRSRDA